MSDAGFDADLKKLQSKIDHDFRNEALLRDALTHSSAAAEANYERLEFLGDRVLGLVMAHVLYQKFPNEAEGDLAKRQAALVQGTTLAEIAISIDLGDYIYFSDAERAAGGADNEHILADSMEALIGALYLDHGLGACEELIKQLWGDTLYTMKKPPLHPKTELQELLQGKNVALPAYEITDQNGPDHAPVFEITLSVKGFDPIKAEGRSRSMAEKEAAEAFLNTYRADIEKNE